MELIDSHAHIDFPQFAEDRDDMLERARAAGVSTLLAIGTGPGPEKLDSALPFAEQHDWIYATVGIHPHEAKEVTSQHLEELARLAQHPKVIAWGEIGLDYYYDHSPREAQARVFRDQMALARRAKKPIIIHCRDAWTDCLNMIEEHWRPTGLGGHGLSDFFCGKFNLSKNSEPSRRCESFAIGEDFDRDGRSVPRAAALSRQAQRAGLRCGSGAHACDCERLDARRNCRGHDREFSALFWPCPTGEPRGIRSQGR